MIAVRVVEPELDSGAAHGRVVDMEEKEGDRITRLEVKVEHIQSDVSDLKVEVRRTNDKLDKLGTELNAKIDGIKEGIHGVRLSLAAVKVWAISLHTALGAALLLVMAKGFKWL